MRVDVTRCSQSVVTKDELFEQLQWGQHLFCLVFFLFLGACGKVCGSFVLFPALFVCSLRQQTNGYLEG